MKPNHKISKFLTIDNIPHNVDCVCLAPYIRLRREYLGGLVYDTRNGNIVEVDKSAFQFLDLIKDRALKINNIMTFLIERDIIKQSDTSTHETLQKLFELKIIKETEESSAHPVFIAQESNRNKDKPWLSAPETVHWAVTYHCEENCSDCYAARFSPIKNELNTGDALKLIDKIAEWNVFQLAIGGGEPFTRKDLPELVLHAAAQGLSVHLTTGRLPVDPGRLESISSSIKTLRIGIKSENLLGADPKRYNQQVRSLFDHAQMLGMEPGANVFLTRSVVRQLENLVTILMNIGFNRIIFLRYKPPKSIKRWKQENPDPFQMKGLHGRISKIIKENPRLKIRVDCALSFTQRNLSKEITTQHGIKGCVAADRILAVAPDGSVYPCSQLVHPRCNAGNLLDSDPEALWNKAGILRKYRLFQTKKAFTHSWCGVCLARHACGGCRVFAMDGLGGDPGCPEPLLPPLTQIGKTGRGLDLIEYLEEHSIISMAEYMERYGVGQQKAIKELNASPHTSSTVGGPVRKRNNEDIKHTKRFSGRS